MKSKPSMSSVSWMGKKTAPREYEECILGALRRMAILLNSPRLRSISLRWLSKSDPYIKKMFVKYKLSRLIVFSKLKQVGSKAELMSTLDQAENGFYGKFNFSFPRKVGGGLRVTFEITPAFLSWSYKELYRPLASNTVLQRQLYKNESVFMKDCATNYLLKNFWHNYVHNALQDIHELNYWKFSGDLTVENDFEADNLATLLLVRSYGLKLITGGRSANVQRAKTEGVLSRNQCNYVFRERENLRNQNAVGSSPGKAAPKRVPSFLDAMRAFGEHEWYFRRRIANQLSARLLADGHVVTRIGVYCTGEIHMGKSGPFRKGTVVIRLNGSSIDTNAAVYVIDTLNPKTTQAQRNFQRDRIHNIVSTAVNIFGANMKRLKEVRAHAIHELLALSARMGGISL